MLKITEAGRARCASPKFAEDCETFLCGYEQMKPGFIATGAKFTDKDALYRANCFVAYNLCSREAEYSIIVTKKARKELTKFFLQNSNEMGAIMHRCFPTLWDSVKKSEGWDGRHTVRMALPKDFVSNPATEGTRAAEYVNGLRNGSELLEDRELLYIIDDKHPDGGLLYVFRDHSSVAYKPDVN